MSSSYRFVLLLIIFLPRSSLHPSLETYPLETLRHLHLSLFSLTSPSPLSQLTDASLFLTFPRFLFLQFLIWKPISCRPTSLQTTSSTIWLSTAYRRRRFQGLERASEGGRGQDRRRRRRRRMRLYEVIASSSVARSFRNGRSSAAVYREEQNSRSVGRPTRVCGDLGGPLLFDPSGNRIFALILLFDGSFSRLKAESSDEVFLPTKRSLYSGSSPCEGRIRKNQEPNGNEPVQDLTKRLWSPLLQVPRGRVPAKTEF